MVKGSHAWKYLQEFCQRFRVQAVEGVKGFHGFMAGTAWVNYRHGYKMRITVQKRGVARVYPRWQWKTPLGKKSRRGEWRYVLLHGPQHETAPERFFLIPTQDLEQIFAGASSRGEIEFTIPAERLVQSGPLADAIYEYELTAAQLRERLKKLERD